VKTQLECFPCFLSQALNTAKRVTAKKEKIHNILIISKGQGNYEGLSDEIRPIFFLLKAKCPVVASDIGVPLGSILLKKTNI